MSEVVIDIPHALAFLKFRAEVSTGPSGCDTSPGIGFTVEPYPDNGVGLPYNHGVIGRSEAAHVVKLFTEFLAKHGDK